MANVNNLPGISNWSIYRGDTLDFWFSLKDSTGALIDTASLGAALQVRNIAEDPDETTGLYPVVINATVGGSTQKITLGISGVYNAHLLVNASVTLALSTDGRYVYDFQIWDPGSIETTTQTILEGKLTVKNDITRT